MLKATKQLLYDWSTYRRNLKSIGALEEHLRTQQPTLLVHQMGRAGSMTTVSTLKSTHLPMPVFHTHWLNPRNIQRRIDHFNGAPDYRLPFNVRIGMRVSEALRRDGPGRRPWHLVTVFREPIARNLSVFFLSIEVFIKNFFRRHARGELSDAEVLEIFMRDFPHDQPLNWFDEEVREVFGVDVFEHPFPVEQGFQIIRIDNINMLLIKVEELNNCFERAFREFLGVDIPELRQTHITEKDPSYSMYRDFIDGVSFPQAYLDRMYDSRFARHFYTPAELAILRTRWGKRLETAIG